MAIDFSEMMDADHEKLVHPRDVFFTLNRQADFAFPRDIQTEVMNSWFDSRERKDNIIKLNVGSGKTLVGLLVLQSSINEGNGPALYVSPNNQLVQQVIQEAHALGIAVTDDPRDPTYLGGERVCIINVYKLFNGKSVFGVRRVKLKIGSLVVDDAHACLSVIAAQFRLTLEHAHPAYEKILARLGEDLRAQNEARYLEVVDRDPNGFIEVPFWSWQDKLSAILQILHEHRGDEALQFTYPLLADVLRHCRCVIGGQRLEIEPHFPPTDLIPSFRRATRRIYMTATLADDSVVVTHFGAKPEALQSPIVPASSQSMGERMILMPQELNPALSLEDVQSLLRRFSDSYRIVVIVPSEQATVPWRPVANEILRGEEVGPGVERLRSGSPGMSVLVNRYDGIDLPGAACRILVLVGLPEVMSYADRVDSELLSDAAVNLRQQIERIEQGMGRGVRSNDDHCVVLLVGAKLISRLRSSEGHSMLTPATRAQLEGSRRIADQLDKPSLAEIETVIRQCLNRDPHWLRFSKQLLVNLPQQNELSLDSGKLAARRAFDDARANRDDRAVAGLDPVISAQDDPQVKAWLLSRKASLLHARDSLAAQKALAAAHELEPSVLKPIAGVQYKKLARGTNQQAARLLANHHGRFIDDVQVTLYGKDLTSDLQFTTVPAGRFEDAMNSLAWFLGIESQRPERDFQEGPDNLWALPDGRFLVVECKSNVSSDQPIAKKHVAQLGQSMEWFKSRYLTSKGVPLLIHPKSEMGPGATPVSNMRVLDEPGLSALRQAVSNFVNGLNSTTANMSAGTIAGRLSQHGLDSTGMIERFSKPPG